MEKHPVRICRAQALLLHCQGRIRRDQMIARQGGAPHLGRRVGAHERPSSNKQAATACCSSCDNAWKHRSQNSVASWKSRIPGEDAKVLAPGNRHTQTSKARCRSTSQTHPSPLSSTSHNFGEGYLEGRLRSTLSDPPFFPPALSKIALKRIISIGIGSFARWMA